MLPVRIKLLFAAPTLPYRVVAPFCSRAYHAALFLETPETVPRNQSVREGAPKYGEDRKL